MQKKGSAFCGNCSVKTRTCLRHYSQRAWTTQRKEMKVRGEAIASIIRNPGRALTEAQCTRLGDAVFSIQCPADAVVLTTNTDDHGPLAAALEKTALEPTEV